MEAQITASGPPAYITALPQDVQADVGSVINAGLSIVASDFEASSLSFSSIKKPSMTKIPGLIGTGTGAVKATGTGVVSYNGSTGSPLAFTGAAGNVNANIIGAGLISAFGLVLALL